MKKIKQKKEGFSRRQTSRDLYAKAMRAVMEAMQVGFIDWWLAPDEDDQIVIGDAVLGGALAIAYEALFLAMHPDKNVTNDNESLVSELSAARHLYEQVGQAIQVAEMFAGLNGRAITEFPVQMEVDHVDKK